MLFAEVGVEVDAGLLERALTHRSYAYENGGLPTNERLEFLGDSVLGVVVTETGPMRLVPSQERLQDGCLQVVLFLEPLHERRSVADVFHRFIHGSDDLVHHSREDIRVDFHTRPTL